MTLLFMTSAGLAIGIIAVIIAIYLDETKGN
jgi:biopolymer transport protein ExbB/TolQ